MQRISQAAEQSCASSNLITAQMQTMGQEMVRTRDALGTALQRSESVLGISERLMEMMASCGVHTPDTPYIELAQRVAAQISVALESALQRQRVKIEDLFDEHYRLIEGSEPRQHATRFNALADELFPQFQEPALQALPDIVLHCRRSQWLHLNAQSQLPKAMPGRCGLEHRSPRWRGFSTTEPAWPRHAIRGPSCCKPIAATWEGTICAAERGGSPIVVQGRHWGGLRLAYRFTT